MEPVRSHDEVTIDTRVKNMLDRLRPVPPRDPRAAVNGRARFMAEVNELQGAKKPAPPSLWQQIEEAFSVNRSYRFGLIAVLTALMIGVFLFGGAGMTALAAQNALPGDALWSVKTGVEQTRIALSRGAATRAELNLQIADRRLDEVSQLISEGRYDNLGAAVDEFQARIQDAIAELQTVAAGDPARAQALAADLTVALTRYAKTLGSMAAGAPEPARMQVQRALQVTERASGDHRQSDQLEFSGTVDAIGADFIVVSGQRLAIAADTEMKGTFQVGDNVNVHAFVAADGTLTAREIELAPLVIGNDNQNQNDNESLNENENLNENEDLNENENQNANINENQNQNQNENQNANLNENENENEGNHNANLNGNQNGDGDHEGNRNSNLNGNQNGDDHEGNHNTNGNQNGGDDHEGNHNSNGNQNSGGEEGGGGGGGGGD